MKFRLKQVPHAYAVGDKIPAIRAIRAQFGFGLKEAKEIVELAMEIPDGATFNAHVWDKQPGSELPDSFTLENLTPGAGIISAHKRLIVEALELDLYDLAGDLIQYHKDLTNKYGDDV